MSTQIYADYNASTTPHEDVIHAMQPYLNQHACNGNPSRKHWAGVGAKEGLESARKQVASFWGSRSDEVVFTSGGTESNNHAILGTYFAAQTANPTSRKHIITTEIEHPATLKTCEFLEKTFGVKLTQLKPNEYGHISPQDLKNEINENTILVSIMHANNEFGTIQPIAEISEIVKKYEALLHVDAVCSAGKIPVNIEDLGCDLLSISGHKIHAPKGIGALYIKHSIAEKVAPLIYGAGQQDGRRSGTDSVPLAVGLGTACKLSSNLQHASRLHKLSVDFLDKLHVAFPGNIEYNGHPEPSQRLPNTVNISFLNQPLAGYKVLEPLQNTIAATAGDDCTAAVKTLGKSKKIASKSIRFSFGKNSTDQDIDTIVKLLEKHLEFDK